jgi:hypothetical protein
MKEVFIEKLNENFELLSTSASCRQTYSLTYSLTYMLYVIQVHQLTPVVAFTYAPDGVLELEINI